MCIRCKDLQIRPKGASHISICEDFQVVSVDSQRTRILNRAHKKNRAVASILRGRYLCQCPLVRKAASAGPSEKLCCRAHHV